MVAAVHKFGWDNYLVRLVAAISLVLLSYNPEGWSYFHWVRDGLDASPRMQAVMVFCGVVLLIGWAIFLRATFRSLGVIGTFLAVAFFASLFWLVIVYGLVAKDNVRAISYLILIGLAGVLSAGVSWSHIRRRITGQLDVDDADN